jgi:hypothetical protein
LAKQTLKRVVPRSLWSYGSNTYWWWFNRGRHQLAKTLDQRWRLNQGRLSAYQDKHRGKRCFILGNGPSLRDTDLSLLKDEFTFGLNRIYLLFPETGFNTTYLVSVNELVLEQYAGDFKKLDLPKFFTWRARNWFPEDIDVLWVDSDYTGAETFTTNVTERVFEGFTVTYVALQLAFYMGFSEVVLIGVDHNFQTKGPPNVTVTSQGDDPNHFAPDYFGKGVKWQLPDLDGSERAYRLARKAYEASGRRILDATIGGKLTIFPKADYYSLFKS